MVCVYALLVMIVAAAQLAEPQNIHPNEKFDEAFASRCQPVNCHICRFGFKSDDQGCISCECLKESALSTSGSKDCYAEKECPVLKCDIACKFGNDEDEIGCPTCKCKEDLLVQVCQANRCDGCKFGFKRDLNGCPTCQCLEKCCKAFKCLSCINGYLNDADGCPTCECQPEGRASLISPSSDEMQFQYSGPYRRCPMLRCAVECKGGYKINKQGCNTCECLPSVERDSLLTSSSDERQFPYFGPYKRCPMLRCAVECKNGYKINRHGCKTCKCLPSVGCPRIMCDKKCYIGYRRNKYGCKTCECLLPSGCPRIMCDKKCYIGYRRNKYGCKTCGCLLPSGEINPPSSPDYSLYGDIELLSGSQQSQDNDAPPEKLTRDTAQQEDA